MEQMTLRQWMGYRQITQREMARRMGVTVQTIHRWQECAAKMRVVDLCRIADILGCKITDIKLFCIGRNLFIDIKEGQGEKEA